MNNLIWFIILMFNPVCVIFALSGYTPVTGWIYANLIGSIIFGMFLQDILNEFNERSS